MQTFLDILLRPEAASQLESVSLAGLASNRRVLKAMQLCPVRSSVTAGARELTVYMQAPGMVSVTQDDTVWLF